MILAHTDSHGNDWYFRIDAPRNAVARIARKLSKKAERVAEARNNAALSRAMLAEAVQLADLQAYNGATREDFNDVPVGERFTLNTAEV